MKIYNNYSRQREPRLYKATFTELPNDNRMFRAWNDIKAMDRAAQIAIDCGYGNIRSLYEVNPVNFKIIRAAFSYGRA